MFIHNGFIYKQAGAELCQAQAQVGLPGEAELMLSSMEVPSTFGPSGCVSQKQIVHY